VLLKHYLEQGFTITAIAERLAVDRRTIQRWIAAGQLDMDPSTLRYGPRRSERMSCVLRLRCGPSPWSRDRRR
jgi:transposase